MTLLGFFIGAAVIGWFVLMFTIAVKAWMTAVRQVRQSRATNRAFAQRQHEIMLAATEAEVRANAPRHESYSLN